MVIYIIKINVLNVYDNFCKYYQNLKEKLLSKRNKNTLIKFNNGYIYIQKKT